MDPERTALINAVIRHKNELEFALNENRSNIFKSSLTSEKARKIGNKLFVLKNHDAQTHRDIFDYYSKSVALALSDSEELALAYGNRSAFLLHIDQYNECLADIEKACRITSSANLKVKLLCRKVECLKKLGIAEYQKILEVAQNMLDKVDSNDKDKIHLVNRINRVAESPIGSYSELEKGLHKSEVANIPSKSRDEILSSIRIEHNKKFGRHLIVVKDYNVGDVIFTEKLYASTTNPRKCYTNCHHCLKNCWSSVPCIKCSWAIFCSENCRQKAWNTYHNMECSVVSHLQNTDFLNNFHICLRMLVTGLEEAGSISQLKSNVLCVDKCADISSKGFFTDGKFISNSLQSIYSLTISSDISEFTLDQIAKDVIMVLILLVKCSCISTNCQLKEIEDVLKNEDLIFIGSLLIKLCKIKINNAHNLSNIVQTCELSLSIDACETNGCCTRGIGLGALLSLINHSCFPNADKCFTEDQKVVVYALQPIKKNSQIFISYFSSHHVSLSNRQNFLKKYGFICDCQSCIELWPVFPEMPIKDYSEEELTIIFQNNFERNLYEDCEYIFKAVSNGKSSCDKNTIKKLSKAYLKAWKSLKRPSLLMHYLTEALRIAFSAVYGLKTQSFMKCKDNK